MYVRMYVCIFFVFETRVSLTLELTVLTRLASEQTPRITLSLLPNAGITSMCHSAWLLYGFWGSELRSPCLGSKHLPTDSFPQPTHHPCFVYSFWMEKVSSRVKIRPRLCYGLEKCLRSCSCTGPKFNSQHGGSQPSIAPVPGNSVTSDLCRHRACT